MVQSSTPNWLWRFDAHHRLLMALGAAGIVGLMLPRSLSPGIRALITWDAGILCLLLLVWSVIMTAHPNQIRRRAQTDDTNRVVIAGLVISAALVSLFGIILLLGTKGLPPAIEALQIALTLVAVVASWLIVHTMFCLRYAHLYYSPSDISKTEPSGGLDFPIQNQSDQQSDDRPAYQPDYLDFAYFSFVVGMTAQVSDVEVTSRSLRRLVLLHGLLSFAFNTIVIALTVNIVSQLLS
jgi:uncharacterized membrane protein